MKDLMENWRKFSDIEEGKKSSERQEHQFVETINKHSSTEKGKMPLTILFQKNNMKLENVLGAQKIEGMAAYGKEPYTDVVVQTLDNNYNFSMKGVSAPSLAGAGAKGIEKMIPGWLANITPKVVQRLLDMGFEDGDWFVNKKKDLKSIMNKIANSYERKYPNKPVVFVGYPDGKIYSLDAEDAINKSGKKIKVHKGEIIPYIGNATVKVEDNQISILNRIEDNEAAKHLPDMYFKIDEESIRTLLAGTEEMGGPIDYIYKGPMDVKYEWDLENRILTFIGAAAHDIDNFVDSYPDIYLRIRKRRSDQPFSPLKAHPNLGKAIFGKGIFTRESSARIVIADKISSKAEYGGEL